MGKGGRLWVQDECGTHPPPTSASRPCDAPEGMRGVYMDPYMRWVCFDARRWHCVESPCGERYSLALYSPMGLWRLSNGHWRLMRKQGFDSVKLRSISSSDREMKVEGVAAGRARHEKSVNSWLLGELAVMQESRGQLEA
eukprot:5445737-Amphidinium_carterae.1